MMDLSEVTARVSRAEEQGTTLDGASEIQRLIRNATETIARSRSQALAASNFKRAAIPERFASRTLESFESHCQKAGRALSIAQNYADNFSDALQTGRSLIFAGGVGAGKTHLAAGIANRILAAGHSALFTSVIGAIRTVKETYRKDSQMTESAAIAAMVKPDLLILDEVGVQFGSETEKMILFEIINGRYESLRPTIAISNLAKEPLTEYLGERVVDRMREGGGQMVIFDWASYRRMAG